MICMRGGFVIQRHNELRDLEAELLNMVCKDVATEPVLQDVEGEQLTRRSNKAQDARQDIHARGFWEPQRSASSDARVCHPNAEPRIGIRTWSRSKYIVYTRMKMKMRMKKSSNTQLECSIANMEHSPL